MPLRASSHPGGPNSPSCSALAWYSCWPGLSPWGESWKRTRVARTAALTRYRYATQPKLISALLSGESIGNRWILLTKGKQCEKLTLSWVTWFGLFVCFLPCLPVQPTYLLPHWTAQVELRPREKTAQVGEIMSRFDVVGRVASQQTHYVNMTSLLRQNDVILT